MTSVGPITDSIQALTCSHGQYVGRVLPNGAFRCAGGPAAHQQHRRIVWRDRPARRATALVDLQQTREFVVACGDGDAMTVALFTRDCERTATQPGNTP
mgnify:CR=1 FL=1